MEWLVRLLGNVLPIIPLAVALLGGIWAIGRLGSSAIRARADRTTAIRLVIVTSIVAFAVATLLFASIASMFSSNPPNFAIGLPWGVVAGGFVGLSGILGYALLAGRRIGSGAIAGVIAGPVALTAVTALGIWISISLQQAATTSEEATRAQQIAQRSTAVHAAVDGVEVETAQGGSVVAAVRLRLALSTDVTLTFDPTLKEPAPHFRLIPPVGFERGSSMDSVAPAGSPTSIAAQGSAVYELAFRYPDELINATSGTDRAAPPGAWTLEISFTDPAVGDYVITVPVEVR